MSSPEQAPAAAPDATTTEKAAPSILDQVIGATKQTEKSRAEDLVRTLAEEVMKGTVTYNKNVGASIEAGINALDEALSKQLAAIMHHKDFLKLEGTWRGMHYLVMNSETSAQLKIKVLNLPKREAFKDLDRASEFDQSQLFKKIYETEFSSPVGEAFGSLIADYEFTNHPEDISLMEKMSNVSAAAFCPTIAAAAPTLFGFEGWTELSKPRDLEKIFESIEYTKW